jgi:thiamine pyrophosphate-dependent acetolactate synthase large subunit-like protein
LDFPGDLLGSILPEGVALETPLALPEPPKVYSDPADVKRAVDLLKTAQRPLLIVGKGAAYAHAENVVNEFVKETNIPVITFHYSVVAVGVSLVLTIKNN